MKQILLFIVIAFLFFSVPRPLMAQMDHMDMNPMTQTDSVYTGTLQVNPEMPTAQEQVTLVFTLNDKTHEFQINNCDCRVGIQLQGKLPYIQKITTPAAATGGLYSVMVPFVFPRGGTYTISFTGNPKAEGTLQPFAIQWHFSVKSATNEIQTLKTPKHHAASNMLLLGGAVLILLVLSGILFFKKKLR